MNRKTQLLLLVELIGWIATGLIIAAVLYPIHKSMRVWPFESWNILYIVVLVTLSRYLFLLPHTFLASRQVLKFIIIILLIPATFALVQGLNGFMTYVEEQTWSAITGHLPPVERRAMEEYLWNEMIFFAAGSIISAPVLAGRLLISIWRTHNEDRA
ncbi:MAG: hypothetical protein SFV52_04670 [Saprospiraceae bacterium]|nr:hypothetical protein [Saprospiraceae bacterium]